MKTILLLLFPILFSLTGYSQEVLRVQNGASVTLQTGAGMTVMGDVTLDNGSLLSNSGVLTIKQNGASGSGNFSDLTATPYHYGPGEFYFNASGGNRLSSNNLFGLIDVSTTNLTLNSTITASEWSLDVGEVITGAYTAVVLGTTSLSLQASTRNTGFARSWINGHLRRYIDPATNESYQFALGGSGSNIASLENLSASPLTGVQYIDVSFGSKPGTDAGLTVTENGAQYVAVNPAGVWHFMPDNQPSSGKFDLKLSTNGFTGLSDNLFAILQRPDGSADAADWQVPAGSSLSPVNGDGRLVSDGYALRKDVSTFGQFGIGETTVPLPITLTSFDATRLSKSSVQLNWQTQTESNNKGFEIERRSGPDTSFATDGFVNSGATNGNSAGPLDYAFTDSNSYSGITYYRLKQTDLDGTGYYSLIKAVNGFNGTYVSVLLWPNPTKGQFSVKIDGNSGNSEVIITDLQGKTIRRIAITGNQQIDVYGLAAGAYVITIPNAIGMNENFTQKILVIK
jgi:hypothetical protein